VANCVRWLGLVGIVLGTAGAADAQGLIWKLPKPGTWVRYEGTLKQVNELPNTPDGRISLEWIRSLTMKSLESVTVPVAGKPVTARWIEIKSLTGKPSEAGIDTGPAGAVLYKVLVPEAAVIGKPRDAAGVHVSFLPILQGWRKIGNKPAEKLETGVLQVYPLVCLLAHYPTLAEEGQAGPLEVRLGTVSARMLKGSETVENREGQIVNEGTLWIADETPFGLAKWTVKIVRKRKLSIDPRDRFVPVSTIEVEMSAFESGDGAQSELVDPDAPAAPAAPADAPPAKPEVPAGDQPAPPANP
jgi:hypothetical protein